MYVGNEKIAIVFFLHFQKAAYRAEIVSQVQVPGWPDAANYNWFTHFVQ